MIEITEYPQLKLYWYDEERTILVGEISEGWTWTNAHAGLEILNDTVKVYAKTQPVYVILHFKNNAQSLPKGESAIANMRKALGNDPSDETLTIVVAQSNLIGSLIKMANRMYQLAYNESKYRYVATFERAIEMINEHKQGK